MDKKSIAVLVCAVCIGAMAAHRAPLDGCYGNFLSLIFKEHTIYTDGYSNRGYRNIRNGMTKNDVLAIIGEPFYTNEDWKRWGPEERWWYTKSPDSTHYRMREVRFIEDAVSRKVHYYYVD